MPDVTPQIGAIIVAAIGLLGVILQSLRGRPRNPYAELRELVDLLNALPAGSGSRRILEDHIDRRIAQQLNDEALKRRDPTGIVLGIALMVLALAAGTAIWMAGGWWNVLQIFPAVIATFGLAGFIQDVRRQERDEKGNPVKRDTSS